MGSGVAGTVVAGTDDLGLGVATGIADGVCATVVTAVEGGVSGDVDVLVAMPADTTAGVGKFLGGMAVGVPVGGIVATARAGGCPTAGGSTGVRVQVVRSQVNASEMAMDANFRCTAPHRPRS